MMMMMMMMTSEVYQNGAEVCILILLMYQSTTTCKLSPIKNCQQSANYHWMSFFNSDRFPTHPCWDHVSALRSRSHGAQNSKHLHTPI